MTHHPGRRTARFRFHHRFSATLLQYRSLPVFAAIAALLIPASSAFADPTTTVTYRLDGAEVSIRSGSWIPAAADIRVGLSDPGGVAGRSYRLEVLVLQDGERVKVDVPGIQEWEKETRKWIHTDVRGEEAARGRWIWSGTLRPGDVVTVQWRDSDTARVVPHPVTLRIVESFGAKLAFSTPVSIVFPVSGESTAAASAGFAVRYYRTSNSGFWRSLNRIGFPAIGFAYADVGGEKSVLYSVGISTLDDQFHIYYGGFRNDVTANNFWMIGFSLKTKDLMAAAKRAIK